MRRFARAVGVASLVALTMAIIGCGQNMFTGNLTPVPPVHRLPNDMEGAVILIDKDPTIETKDPNHVLRANEQGVPRDFRASMTNALVLAGFRVTSKDAEPHDLVAKLAIAVTEDGEKIRQVYRCGLAGSDGTPVVQIDWAWPKGTFVGELEVFDFATHNVATEVATSRQLHTWLRARPSSSSSSSSKASAADGGAPSVATPSAPSN